LQSASSSKERAVGGVTSGLIAEGQEVEWKAKHLGLWWKMRVRVTAFTPPEYFQDSMTEGPFSSFTHDHNFHREAARTLMVDRIRFRSPLPVAGRLLDRLVVASHLRKFVESRNAALKAAAESEEWRRYLQS
jgi:ligand-binding SRPBCC domain-containing protein